MSKKGRDKGGRGQRQVAKIMSDWWGTEFTSTPLSGGFATKQFRDDWNAAGDIVTPDDSFPFCVEVKNAEGWNLEQLLLSEKGLIWKWWEQTVGETPEGKIPLLAFTRNHKPYFYMVYMGDIPAIQVEADDEYGRNSAMTTEDPDRQIVEIGLLDRFIKLEKDEVLRHVEFRKKLKEGIETNWGEPTDEDFGGDS